MSGRPVIGIVSSTGAMLNVRSVPERGCRLSCTAPAHLFLLVGAAAVAGTRWEPSYCGSDPGSDVHLRVTLPGGTVSTIAVRNLGGAGKPIHAPSCTRALAETRLFVERFADHKGHNWSPLPRALLRYRPLSAEDERKPVKVPCDLSALMCGRWRRASGVRNRCSGGLRDK